MTFKDMKWQGTLICLRRLKRLGMRSYDDIKTYLAWARILKAAERAGTHSETYGNASLQNDPALSHPLGLSLASEADKLET